MILLADAWQTFGIGALDTWRYILLAAGLGFIIFFHELGHFLAAKYCGVMVEQFAVGFGPAIVAWRKGIGLRRGTTTPEVEKRVEAHIESRRVGEDQPPLSTEQVSRAMTELGLGETEYRFNWMPLGGYVKMLGQDDLNPDAQSEDPRAYNKKSIPARMLIVSAGVMMNIFLAAIGFMIVYLMGFSTAPAEVGGVLAGSPASFAQTAEGVRVPLAVGDHILYFDGKFQHEFAKVALSVALVKEGETIPVVVRHRDGQQQTLYVTPIRPEGEAQGLLTLGVFPPMELRGPDVTDKVDDDLSDANLVPADMRDVRPGETILAINGRPVSAAQAGDNYWMLDQALADSDGKPVVLTVRAADGSTRDEPLWPHFQGMFGDEELNFAGMVPRTRVGLIAAKTSPAYGKVLPDDVIESIKEVAGGTVIDHPSPQALREAVNAAGQQNQPIILTLADPSGVSRQTPEIIPTAKLADDRRGLDIQLGYDEQNTVVAEVTPDSAADKAGIKPGWRITEVAGQPVSNWFQVRHLLSGATAAQPVPVKAQTPTGDATVQLTLAQDQIDNVKFLTFTSDLTPMLREHTELRKTSNPIVAAGWGVSETRDFVLQFYIMLRRMVAGSVSYKQAMGPVGIVRFGAMSAARGTDWLVWFLAMISANLAVANFLPIPVMDGGLFVLLILEAIQGRPLSMKAQQVMQFVGLAIILSIFILVTYQDLTRQFGHG